MRSSSTPSSSYNSPSYSSSSSASDSDSSSNIKQGRIFKLAKERRERRATMAKLQQMVPYAREGDSQLQLLQHIMDYIYFLQQQLQKEDAENMVPMVSVSDLSRLFSQFSTDASRSVQHHVLSN
ncbi:unnamed protein product [Anisakis simplex]|uniref:BHLH domain-containing protein n=1 Tax=Anisakis simplex TaxID=6269 RepID=A0A0M3K204_ANISI|nr:unnamed protein product [Anisakis simplex]